MVGAGSVSFWVNIAYLAVGSAIADRLGGAPLLCPSPTYVEVETAADICGPSVK